MEMQFFVKPGEEMKWYDYWKSMREKWHKNLGLGESMYRFHDHIKLAHYANAACDIEFNFPMGFKELEGIHSRTDFDLKQHEKHSGKKLAYFDPELNKSYVPYVVETSIGLDRMFLAVLSASFNHEILDDQSKRIVLRIPPALAPVKVAILPLVKKDGLPEIGMELANQLKFEYNIQIDQKDSIGKRYRRQDAIGTPICITIDHETKEDQCVTVRYRDTMKQERISINKLKPILDKELSWQNLLNNLN
jgi:glycyl-tRNA synthetase